MSESDIGNGDRARLGRRVGSDWGDVDPPVAGRDEDG